MKKKFSLSLLLIAILFSTGLLLRQSRIAASGITMPSFGSGTETPTGTDQGETATTTWPHNTELSFSLFDQANLLSTSEADSLIEQGNDLVRRHEEINVAVITTDDAEGKEPVTYGDDFFEAHNLGYGYGFNGVYLLIDMDNRNYRIGTFGKAIDILTDARIETVLDEMNPGMVDGDYYDALNKGLASVDNFITLGIPQGNEVQPKSYHVAPLQLIASLGAFTVVGLGTGLGYRTKVRKEYDRFATRPAYDSAKEATADYAVIADNVIDKQVVHVYAPVQKSSSVSRSGGGFGGGGSSTHSTGGGRSAGGGGRSF